MMGIPLSYNFRSLAVRKSRTCLTVLGMALAVSVFISVSGLVEGLQRSLQATGDPRNVLVLSKGSSSEMGSMLSRGLYDEVRVLDGVARDAAQQPQASLELVVVANLADSASARGTNVTIRGLSSEGVRLRSGAELTQGRWFVHGQREAVVGQQLLSRVPGLKLGGALAYGGRPWLIVGIIGQKSNAYAGEIWADLNQLSAEVNRADILSSALLHTTSVVDAQSLIAKLNGGHYKISAQNEPEYYQSQMDAAIPVESAGFFVSFILAVGGALITMMTMFSSVADRSGEIATLRVLGFSRASILVSFLCECVLLAVAAGVGAVLVTAPLNWIETGIGSFSTMTEIPVRFHIGAVVVGKAIAFATLLALAGGLIPARTAARSEIVASLRR